MAEKLTFKKIFADSTHIYTYENFVGTQRFFVNGACYQLFARTIFAQYQHIGIGLGYFVYEVEYIAHRGTLADHFDNRLGREVINKLFIGFFELAHLLVRGLELGGCRERGQQFFILPRLEYKVGSPFFERLYGHFHIAKGRNHNHHRLGVALQDFAKPIKAFFATGGILAEVHIEQNYIVAVLVEQKGDFLRVLLNHYLLHMFFEKHFGGQENIFVVVYNQDFIHTSYKKGCKKCNANKKLIEAKGECS